MSEVRRSEIVAEFFRSQFVAGWIEIEEMEAGIEHALRGNVSDAEWVRMCVHARLPVEMVFQVVEQIVRA